MIRTVVAAALLVASTAAVMASAPEARADYCVGNWSIGVGDFTDSSSRIFEGLVSSTVAYDSQNPVTGLQELDRQFWEHRSWCGDHIKLLGYGEGAALVHTWVTEHKDVGNANAILLADPKRSEPGFGGPGMSIYLTGYPLAGVDNDFGDFPVLTICSSDVMCDTWATPGVQAYAIWGHDRYDQNSYAYGQWDRGVRWSP